MKKGKDRQLVTTSKQDGLDSESADFPNAPSNPSMASDLRKFLPNRDEEEGFWVQLQVTVSL